MGKKPDNFTVMVTVSASFPHVPLAYQDEGVVKQMSKMTAET